MDVGAYLRAARERRGLTLEQVASSTKLSPFVLRSIESNAWDDLPGGLLIRGHLRAYARAVGLSPEDVVHAYAETLPPSPVAAPPSPHAAAMQRFGPEAMWWSAAALIAVVGVYTWWSTGRDVRARAPRVAEEAALPPGEAPPRDRVPVTAGAPEPLFPASPLSVAIDATGPCWVSARADGQVVVYRLLAAGERATVTAGDELVLRIGDAAAFSYTVNGLPGRPLGVAGQPVTVTITRDNIQGFVSSPEASRPRHEPRLAES